MEIRKERVAHFSQRCEGNRTASQGAEQINFDILVIFSWLFKNKLRDCVAVQLRSVQILRAFTMLDFACCELCAGLLGAGP
jgi:hypothetical protein